MLLRVRILVKGMQRLHGGGGGAGRGLASPFDMNVRSVIYSLHSLTAYLYGLSMVWIRSGIVIHLLGLVWLGGCDEEYDISIIVILVIITTIIIAGSGTISRNINIYLIVYYFSLLV